LRKKIVIGMAAGVLLFGAGLAYADRWQDQVKAQMVVAVAAMGLNSYQLDLFREGQLDEGTYHRWTLNVGSDQSRIYKIVAACDDDCADIDLELYETDGTKVDEDTRRDSLPVVTVPYGHTGNHTLKVTMYGCAVDPCRYGYAVFSGR
jgi:hypothetical protein